MSRTPLRGQGSAAEPRTEQYGAMRAVFDTNVLVSALIFGNRLAWLRTAWAAGQVIPIVCPPTADELRRVLRYPKFRLSEGQAEALLLDYLPFAEAAKLPSALPKLPTTCRDRDDLVFLALAAWARIPLVTGDAD